MAKGVYKRKAFTKEHKRNIAIAREGKHWIMSEEGKKNISSAQKGKRLSEETKRKLSIVGMRRKHTEETKIKIRERLKKMTPIGEMSPAWRGGTTVRLLKCAEYKDWREAIYERDNYTCQDCGTKGGNGKAVYLEAHHILPWASYPEYIHCINNGMTLCRDCHNDTRGRR